MVEVEPDSEATRLLLERIQTGDRAAFEELFARHRPWLAHLVEARLKAQLRARLDPSDVVQEAHLEAFCRLDDYLERRPMPIRLWLRKTLLQRLRIFERQHLEASRRAVGREVLVPAESAGPLAQQLAGPDPTPSQQVAQDERALRVREAMALLPELDREILFLRTFEGLSYAEVSYILDIDPPTARKRHGRALLHLHKLLTDRGLSESRL
jgi:RNA polymerase sigma-70 factor (ECF subfamily)